MWSVDARQQIGRPFTVGKGANAVAFRPDSRTWRLQVRPGIRFEQSADS
jgi:hypothetical protein